MSETKCKYEIVLPENNVGPDWAGKIVEDIKFHRNQAGLAWGNFRNHKLAEAFLAVQVGIYALAQKVADPDVSVRGIAREIGCEESTLRNYVKLAEVFTYQAAVKGAEAVALLQADAGDVLDPSPEAAAKFSGVALKARNKWRRFQGIVQSPEQGLTLDNFYHKHLITSAARKRVEKAEEEVKALEESRFDIAKREADRVADDLEEIAEDRHPRARIEFMKDAVFADFRLRVKAVSALLDAAAAKKVKRIS